MRGRRLCDFFPRILHAFAYNGQIKTDCVLIFSPLHCINITYTTAQVLLFNKEMFIPKYI